MATAARREYLRWIEVAVKDQGGMSSLLVWARAAIQHVPGAATPPPAAPRWAWAVEASTRVPGPATAAAAPQSTTPPTPEYPPGHTPHLVSFPMSCPTSPAPAPWAPPATRAQAPQPAPWTHQPKVPATTAPWQAACAAPAPPPETRMGSPASHQLIIEVSGHSPETMTTMAIRDALQAHLGSAKHVPLPSPLRGYEYVPCFEAVWRAFAGDHTRALMPVMTAAGYV